MGNCIVTKLTGAVDNSNLFGLNEFRFHVGTKYTQTADTQKIGIAFHSFSTAFEIEVIGSGSFSYRFNNTGSYSSYVTSVTVPVGTTNISMLMSYDTYDVSVFGKSYIKNINIIDASAGCYKNIFFDISQLNYSEIQNLWISGMPATGLFEPKIKSSLVELNANTFNANSANNPAKFDYGINLDSLAGAPNLQYVLARDTSTIGSIESLGSCPQFQYLSVAFSSVTGEVTELAKKQVQNGRTSGNIQLSLIPTNATLNGNAITYAGIGNHWNIYIVFDPNETEGYRIQYTAP